ncbi:hypothetical protein BGY98DRAFT_1049922 [Russula aff. rugulosa BPL654]|nr:hypothetical protein BGY98DRAFT_1049922 [Russula aff. rugulosa BPL654]
MITSYARRNLVCLLLPAVLNTTYGNAYDKTKWWILMISTSDSGIGTDSSATVRTPNAMSNGVLPSLFFTSTFAPCSISTRAISILPQCDAKCSGVKPPELRVFGSAPAR